ncbi:N-formylglutamate amidohydrolase [Ruegeria arenilitoris]|uniref:N-formylglutamate amidohydrolase n=1 Tax=Ruegeria arenilitoris TaxID=1173585 RepID=UPI00157FCEF5|nr:N-formylglutamate amidohydrolase [Ruegeria arenilitoris]
METGFREENASFDVRPRWHIDQAKGPILAAAIHSGHDLRAELVPLLAISEAERFREEDPYADYWATACPTRLLVDRSRFEVDLNRPRDLAVYQTPEQAWGLHVWREPLGKRTVERSLAEYDAFYDALARDLEQVEQQHGTFVILDLHTYNHRRDGPDVSPAENLTNPEINVGTGTMKDRDLWAPLIDRFMSDIDSVPFLGRKLDVRENVKFKGGWFPEFVHQRFPETGCVLSVEVKKFFMNEWTGFADREAISELYRLFRYASAGLLQEWTSL